MKGFWYRFGILAMLLIAPYLLILVLPGTFYPASYFRSLELIKLGAHHKDVEEEIEGVKLFQSLYSEHCSSYSNLADLYYAAQQDELSLQLYRQTWKMGCLMEDGMMNLIHLEAESPDQLEEDLTSWIEQHPYTKDDFYQSLLDIYIEEGNIHRTADFAKSWTDHMPDHAAAWQAFFAYAPYFSTEMMRDKAVNMPTLNVPLDEKTQSVIEAYILSTGETDDVVYYRLGAAYSYYSDWAMAEECFQQSIALEPDRTESWVYLAIALKNQDKDSADAIQEAQNRAGDNNIVRSLMGIYWRDSNPEIAFVFWKKLAASQPEVPEWLIEAGSSLAQLGNLEKAQGYYQQAVDLAPDRVDVRSAYARFCLMYDIDLSTTALQQTRRMIQLEPDNIEGYLLEGQVLYAASDYLTAERMFLHALALDESSAAAHYFLGILYSNINEPDKAWEHLQAASILPDGYYQQAAARLLDSP